MPNSGSIGRPGSRFPIVFLGAGLLTCALVYVPGLFGPLVFDDSSFLIANAAVHVRTRELGDWIAAAQSFPSAHQGRWLGMLSFAANYYFTGLDPFWLKLTNVVIHLLNGVLLFLMLRALFALRAAFRPDVVQHRQFDGPTAAAALAVLWLLLPINLTGVLYVFQRLESLSNTFVLLGLWLYCRERLNHRNDQKTITLWVVLVACTFVGMLIKETAALLPLYAGCLELALTRGRRIDGRLSRPVIALYVVLLGVPMILGSLWLISWMGGPTSYSRSFNVFERLMTEARVLMHYIRWTLLPDPESLSLYHDDIAVSRSLLTPPTTLAAMFAVVALVATAFVQRAKRPLFTLGIFWFFSAHLLTGTVIPLMLAFEHRNYFASIGLLLAGASLLSLEGGLTRSRLRIALTACAFVFYAFVTWMRAEEWSDPVRLAVSEASKRPDSPAAQYELGRALLMATQADKQSSLTEQAFQALERGARIPGADIIHEQLLITTHATMGRAIREEWWDSLIAKLRSRPTTTADLSALTELLHCTERSVCPSDGRQLAAAFDAALSQKDSGVVLLALHAEFLNVCLHDTEGAERELRAALHLSPKEPEVLSAFISLLVQRGNLVEARSNLDRLRQQNRFGALNRRISQLESLIQQASRHEQ